MEIYAPKEKPLTRNIKPGLIKTEEAISYIFSFRGAYFRLDVPEHYIYDGASIPFFAMPAIQLTPQDLEGESLPHDIGYRHQGKVPYGWLYVLTEGQWRISTLRIPKRAWDELMYKLMLHWKINKFKARVVYLAVLVFGWRAWLRDDFKRMEDTYGDAFDRTAVFKVSLEG